MWPVPRRDGDALLDHLLDRARLDIVREAREQVDLGRFAQRLDGGVQDDGVRDHDRVVAAAQDRVEQAEPHDRPVDRARGRARVEPDAIADPEGACAQEHGAGDEVPHRLLSGKTEQHSRQGTADRERLRLQPGDPQRDEDGDCDGEEADQEIERAGGARVEPLEEGRPDRTPDVARQRPAQDHECDHADDSHRHVDPEQLHAVLVREDHRCEERQDHQNLGPRPLRACTSVRAQLSDQSRVHAFFAPRPPGH
jgi:hypothetical protein